MIYLLIFAIGLLLLFLLRAVRRHAAITDLADLERRIVLVDLAAFRNLLDPSEEEHLRSLLSPRDFRRVQRMRVSAAIEYVRGVSHNAAVLLQAGELARSSTDPQTAAAAQELVNNAIRLRMYTALVVGKLYLQLLAPSGAISAGTVVDRYEDLAAAITNLARRQRPAYAGRIAGLF